MLNRADTVKKIKEILESNTNTPSEEMRQMGEVLIKMGDALEGLTSEEALAILQTAQVFSRNKPPRGDS